jgi:hypothetical protein
MHHVRRGILVYGCPKKMKKAAIEAALCFENEQYLCAYLPFGVALKVWAIFTAS